MKPTISGLRTGIVGAVLGLLAFASSADQPPVSLQELASGFLSPVTVRAEPGSERLLVLEQGGTIIAVSPEGVPEPQPWLDLSPAGAGLTCASGERGLLGLAFHPDHAENGWIFLNYTSATLECSNGEPFDTVIARLTVNGGTPELASLVEVLRIAQPFANHNGGDLHFGPDGMLYVGTGDGGSAGDPEDNSQDRASLLGKMLRIDVDVTAKGPIAGNACGAAVHYRVPPDNPFTDLETCGEIWSLGLRNPYRFSFDAADGSLWIADVGQNRFEEINRVPAGRSGDNFGWDCREADYEYDSDLLMDDPDEPSDACSDRLTEEFTAPVFAYPHPVPRQGCRSVTGGYVYRGPVGVLRGHYVAADFCTGEVFVADAQDLAAPAEFQAGTGRFSLAGFGEGGDGSLFAVDRAAGALLRVGSPEQVFASGFEFAGRR